MSQEIFDDIVPGTTSGNQLATILNDFKDAIASGLSGIVRPPNLQAKGGWVDTSLDPIWKFKVWTGTVDIVVFSLDTTNNLASISGASDIFSITKISVDSVGPYLDLVKKRIANNGQVLAADYVGAFQMGGPDNTGTQLTGARVRAKATNNYTPTTSGTDLLFEATDIGSAALAEKMRLADGKLGIGTSSPTETIHAKGTGILSEKSSNDAVGAKVILRKSRIAGTGAVQNSDVIGQVEFNSTDDVTAEILAAKIVSSATENHTSTAQGTSLSFQVKETGTAAFKEQLVIGDNVQIKDDAVLSNTMATLQQIDSTTTGAAQSLSPTKTLLKVTNVSLTSINNVASPTDGKLIVLINGTGATFTITNNSGGTAANRIKTGTGADLTLADGASLIMIYDNAASRWQVVGGSGSGGSLTQGTRTTGISISAATQITPVAGSDSEVFVAGNGGAVIVTAGTPIVTTGMVIGQLADIIGTSDTNTVTYDNGNNLVLTRGEAVLGKDNILTIKYLGSDGSNAAWVEVGRNF